MFLIAAGSFAGGEAHAKAPLQMSVTLRPLAESGKIKHVQVIEVVRGASAKAGDPLFQVPARVTTVQGQPYKDGDVRARDDAGELQLDVTVDSEPSGYPLDMRSFISKRASRGDIHLRYIADVADAMAPRSPGPSYDLRSANGGFGGAPFTFLLMPATEEKDVDFSWSWDLSALPPGSRGVTVHGEGNQRWQESPGNIETLFFLAGNVQGFAPEHGLLKAYWIGNPPFDVPAAAAWSVESFDALKTFFRQPDIPSYTLLMRPYPRPRDGGGATTGGFMLEYGEGWLSDTSRRIMFTHEMVHHFLGQLEGDSGANAWFAEGLAEFYKIRIPLRQGLIDLPSAAREIAFMTDAYYTSPFVGMSFAEIGKRRWSDRSIQNVPYNRGFMYFVNLDASIRRHSHGRRSLDDLVLTMLESRRSGQGYDEPKWRQLLRDELGRYGEVDFNRMLSGELIEPPESAFGPCFTRRRVKRPRPVLGFSEDSLLMKPHVIKGLLADSNASRAGLAEGDAVVSFDGVTPRIAHSAANVLLDKEVHLIVDRGGNRKEVSFSSEGPEITEDYWELTQCTSRK